MRTELSLIPLLFAAIAVPARADDAGDKSCVQAHLDAQRLRREQKLVEARGRMVQCAGSTCPALIRADCANWLDEMVRAVPSVVVSARDEGGHELTDVSVTVVGKLPTRRIDGTPIDLDPGVYKFRYERPGADPIERDVVVQAGVRNRVVEVTFPGGKRLKKRGKPPLVAYVLGGVGVAALGSFTYFGLKGRSEYNELDDECGPNCTSSDTESGRRQLLIADISLGVAALSFAGAAYFFFVYTPPEPTGEQAARKTQIRFQAIRSGGFASVSTRF